ncbi:MAG TPA: hypothetical protein VFI06_09245, partial [Chitinophagaceae bacterium]|nr:hypothetical protein [Chitinophagaceae bacterium]
VARLLKEDYSKGLLGENSELGRWLRTKNVIEKIGDLLFLHGGVSTEINRLPISVTKINELARPNYAVNSGTSKEEATIMSSTVGPFWSRFYFRIRSEKDKEKVLLTIDSTLEKFKVNRIVTGHTIVADTISVHYGGKVINVDTHHAEGKSEALLIDGGEFYRVNAEGKKVLLFIDDKRKLN